jgi:predicted DNA-binding transcriptional regulator AlpA
VVTISESGVIDRHELMCKVARSYAKIWQLMRDGKFPRGRAVGQRTLWLESEIDAWIATERRAIRDELRFLAETWDQQLADLQNMITDFGRKYFEGLRARSTLAAIERDDSTRLH